jgi:pimeloyl-ACP methyl ester carboxylesterase
MTLPKNLPVVFLPGGIQPVEIQYAPLLKVLGVDVNTLLKNLEVYRDETPPPHYTLATEIDGLRQAADQAGFYNFHLVAYSGGGAIALAYAALYPGRVLSLALSEPAVIPSQEWYTHEASYWKQMDHVMSLPDPQLMTEFMRLELGEGVPLPAPPPGDPPAWMALRPAGLKTLVSAFNHFDLPYASIRAFTKPVYLAVGGLSTQLELRKAQVLESLFPDAHVEVYPDRHHFDPPQRAEPERFARALVSLWEKAPIT